MKKYLYLIIALCLLTILFSVVANAETYSGSCGTYLTWSYNTDTGVLNISGSGSMTNFSRTSDRPWHNYRSRITKIVLGSNVTSIGDYAFHGFDELTDINFPSRLTSIGNYAMYNCKSLTSTTLTIPDSVTTIGRYAFYNLDTVKNVVIGNGLKVISEDAFRYCRKLETVVLGNSVTTIEGSAFASCIALNKVHMPKSLTTIETYAFNNTGDFSIYGYKGTYAEEYANKNDIPFNPMYTVTYNANGGSGAPAYQTADSATYVTLSTKTPSRTGYTFKGWSTSSSASYASYTPGGRMYVNQDVTLYAVWQINTYTVTYDANGGTNAPVSQTKTHGVSLTLSSVIPTRENYIFKGWATSKTATYISYRPNGNYTSNSNTTLYAVWEEDPTPRTETTSKHLSDGVYVTVTAKNISAPNVICLVEYYGKQVLKCTFITSFDTTLTYHLQTETNNIKVFTFESLSKLKPITESEELPIAIFTPME